MVRVLSECVKGYHVNRGKEYSFFFFFLIFCLCVKRVMFHDNRKKWVNKCVEHEDCHGLDLLESIYKSVIVV